MAKNDDYFMRIRTIRTHTRLILIILAVMLIIKIIAVWGAITLLNKTDEVKCEFKCCNGEVWYLNKDVDIPKE